MKLRSAMMYVPNVNETVLFYQTAFGMELEMASEDGQYAQLKSGDVALAFANEEAIAPLGLPMDTARPDRASHAVQFAFETDDVSAGFDRAIAAGATPVNAPTARPWGQVVAHIRDLNGFMVEIGSPAPTEW